MRKSFVVVVVLCASVVVQSCKSNSPKAVAEKWLNNFWHFNFDADTMLSTEETKDVLLTLKAFSKSMTQADIDQSRKVSVTVSDHVKVDSNLAIVQFTTSTNKTPQNLTLIRRNGEWLVDFSKADFENLVNTTSESVMGTGGNPSQGGSSTEDSVIDQSKPANLTDSTDNLSKSSPQD